MKEKKKVALVAHDNMKRDLAEWVDWNWEILLRHHLVCTGTTGKMVTRTLTERGGAEEISHFDITLLKSGPLGGDQQLGSMIADGEISALIFFWDPMSAQPHDVDVKALLRIATLYNVLVGRFPDLVAALRARRLPARGEGLHLLHRAGVEVAVHGTPMQKGVDRPSFSFAARGEPPSSFSEALRSTARVLSAVRRRSMRGPYPLVPVALPEANCLQFGEGVLAYNRIFSLSLTVS